MFEFYSWNMTLHSPKQVVAGVPGPASTVDHTCHRGHFEILYTLTRAVESAMVMQRISSC